MSKKLSLFVGALVLSLGLIQFVAPAFATDDELSAPAGETNQNSSSEIDPANAPVVTSETGDGEIAEPTGPSDDNGEVVNPDSDQSQSSDTDKCSTDEAKCEDTEEDTTDADSEIWPMYVSFGALGGALILVIIINVAFGRKHK